MASLSLPAEPAMASSSSSAPEASMSSSASMSASTSGFGSEAEQLRRKKARAREREKNRIIAASAGALITSLTMTPFDVAKTRLQTQQMQESLFVPSSHVPPPSRSAADLARAAVLPTSAIPSARWKGKGRLPPTVASTASLTPLQHARSLAATNLATCCQKTYFTTNLADKNIICRFDPRDMLASASTASPQTQPAVTNAAYPAVARSLSIGYAASAQVVSGSALALDAEQACLYPTPTIAAQELAQLSAASTRHFNGFVDAVVKIARHEGLPALWRGLSPSLVMSVPSQVIYMVGYDTLRTSALDYTPIQFRTATGDSTRSYIATTTFVAGSVSRTAVAGLLAPLELLRTRMQSTGSHVSFSSVAGSVLDLCRTEGPSSLWRGLSATLWRDVPFSGIYWAGYEGIRRLLTGKGMGEVSHGDNFSKTFGTAFVSGAGSGIIAAFCTHPFDVIKTRRQTENSTLRSRSTMTIFAEIARAEGTAGLWRGIVPRVAKIAPACGIMIGAYEIGLRWTGEAES